MEDHEKPIYRGKLPKKGGLGQFADLKEGLAGKEGWCFSEGSCCPNVRYNTGNDLRHQIKFRIVRKTKITFFIE